MKLRELAFGAVLALVMTGILPMLVCNAFLALLG